MNIAAERPSLFTFDNSFAQNLEGFYVEWKPATVPDPALVIFNSALAEELGLASGTLTDKEIAAYFSGNELLPGATPIAQAYAGHQFGGLSPQLGDGRAVLIGEVLGKDGTRHDLQLKGSGQTPFSRGGDGKAALGPMLREYLISEAMHALRIPTTRALAVVTTGEDVYRENVLPGAILTRVAASHIRVGTFQYFAIRQEHDKVKQLADYAIKRHYPDAAQSKTPYLSLYEEICEKQAQLIAKWMLVGFIHGVMNTDNMAISGETIDYGPCAFMDAYDPATVYSSIDRGGRYAFANQPPIAQWNLSRFAETLIPLIDKDEEKATAKLTEILQTFRARYTDHWLTGLRAKLGITGTGEEDIDLINSLHETLDGEAVDFTKFFRTLATALRGDSSPASDLFKTPEKFDKWFEQFEHRHKQEMNSPQDRANKMDDVNPVYVARNHKVEEALAAAEQSDFAPFHKLMEVLEDPFTEWKDYEDYAEPAPPGFGPYKTFCGT